MFNSYGRTEMCPDDRNWPQMGLNQWKWAQVIVNITKWPQMTWREPVIAETFVKPLPAMEFSVRYKPAKPPYIVRTTSSIPQPHH